LHSRQPRWRTLRVWRQCHSTVHAQMT
jgi:hypothetical protein